MNLKIVIEYNLKKKADNSIFDKIWYQSRAKIFLKNGSSIRNDLHNIKEEKPKEKIVSK